MLDEIFLKMQGKLGSIIEHDHDDEHEAIGNDKQSTHYRPN